MSFDTSDAPFPIDRCSKRVANALFREFGGRNPTIGEVMAYRDADWLGTPGFGRKALEEIKLLKLGLQSYQPAPLLPRISDAELVIHLHGLVQEMEAIIGKISQRSRPAPSVEESAWRPNGELDSDFASEQGTRET